MISRRHAPRRPRPVAGALAIALAAAGAGTFARDPASQAPAPPVTHAVALRGSVALVARDRGIDVLDVADTDAPETLGSLGLRASVYDALWWSDSLAFLAAGSLGVVLVDLSDPSTPRPLARVETRGSSRRLARRGDVLFVADEVGGLVLVDASRPERASVRRTVSTTSQVRSVSVDGDLLAIAEGASGVRVFDVSRADAPRRVAHLERRESAADALLAGDTLLVADGRDGLRAYARDRDGGFAGPVPVTVPGRVTGLERRGDLVYVGTGVGGIRFFRIEAPGALVELGGVALPRSIPAGRAFPAGGGRLLVAAGVGGVAVLDVSDLAAPRVLAPRERGFEVRWGD